MKRLNITFTVINIGIDCLMLYTVISDLFRDYLNMPHEMSLYAAYLFIPLLVVANGVWLLIRNASRGVRETTRKNTVFIALDIILAIAMAVHCLINASHGGGLIFSWITIMMFYGIPAVLINDIWFVVYINGITVKSEQQ